MAAPFLRAAILVVSTTASKDPSTDAAEAVLRGVFESDGDGKWEVTHAAIVADVEDNILQAILPWTDGANPVNLIVTTGGTGFAVADITPEVVGSLIQKPAPGLVHGMLAASLNVTPFAVMARPVAGVRKSTILVTLPGSPKGAKENLQAILKMLPHACVQAAGMDSRMLHAGGVKKLERDAGVRALAASASTASLSSLANNGHGHSHDHNHSHTHDHTHGPHSHGGHGHGLVRHAAPEGSPLSNDLSLGPSRRNRSSPFPMISVEEALQLIDENTPGMVESTRPVDEELVGYILAEDVFAPENVPAFRASIVDGYAVQVPPGGGDFTGVFPVVAVSHAAPDEGKVLREGEIARITTGAPLPAGANAVIMVESTILKSMTEDGLEEDEVEIAAKNVRDGDNVREVGSDVKQGALILEKGEKITAVGGEIGLLSSVGLRTVKVCRRPVVGILSTGNEIVPANWPGALRLGEVRDTNRPTLLLAAQEWGFDTVDLGIAADQPQTLEQWLRDSLHQVDVVITTGGVSMGELDLLKPTIERALGGTIHFGRVSMKPGKPTTFATVTIKSTGVAGNSASSVASSSADGNSGHSRRVVRSIFSLPGNPASALVTFHLFVLPALHKMAGEPQRGLPRVPVVLAHDFSLDKERPEYHRAIVSVRADGVLLATSTGGQRSSKVGSMRGANALLCMPAGASPLLKGTKVDALLMSNVRSDL